MLGIMAVMDQKDFYTLVVGPGSGMCKVGFAGLRVDAPRAVLRLVFSGPDCSALRPVWTRRTVARGVQVCVSLVRLRIHAMRQPMRIFGRISHIFYLSGGFGS